MRTDYERRLAKWQTLKLGLIVCLALLAGAGVLTLLSGCNSYTGPGHAYGKAGVGSPARHNVQPMAGVVYEWNTGASIEARYEPWFRVEDPSTRGFPQEVGRLFIETKFKLGK